MASSTGDPRSGGPVAWFRRQEPAIKAAVIAMIGTLGASVIAATVALTIALLNRPSTVTATPEGEAKPPPVSSSAPDTTPPTHSSSTPRPTTPEPSRSHTQSPPPNPLPSPTPTSAAPRPRSRWQGTLTLDGTAGVRGWFLDAKPPSPAPAGDVEIRGSGEIYAPFGLTAWDGAAPPEAQQCLAALNTHLGQHQLDVQPGDMACFTTEYGRVGNLKVISIPDADHITIEATVWEKQ
ncbi:hypothetical protein GCM10011579_076750 [Streptomyces albiflavescens]|uniref:Uncharacterized protein n=1 Tax=Streptomyces albiflavescens TaxID=1623582 RepID=A0A917YCH0_9ACTN|nr:hypothetical protein [Streptomyces albiflavescens]GGN85683.1 hypothetical protein GCM10011579_076750 [Streptomyces albiflavescens]